MYRRFRILCGQSKSGDPNILLYSAPKLERKYYIEEETSVALINEILRTKICLNKGNIDVIRILNRCINDIPPDQGTQISNTDPVHTRLIQQIKNPRDKLQRHTNSPKKPSLSQNMSRHLRPKYPFSVLREQARYLTTKLDVIHLPSRSGNVEDSVPQESAEELGDGPIRYNVCRDQVPAGQKFVFEKKIKQPAASQGELDVEFEPEELTSHSLPIASNDGKGYRTFSVSTTQKNVTLPLKSSKLAKPFPDPVKVMPSHTVSDQEKADQMLAEARVPRSITKSRRI